MMYTHTTDAWTGSPIVMPTEQWLRERKAKGYPPPYRYDKAICSEAFCAMVHGLAIFAALTNGWQFCYVPTHEEAADRERAAEVNRGIYRGD